MTKEMRERETRRKQLAKKTYTTVRYLAARTNTQPHNPLPLYRLVNLCALTAGLSLDRQ